MTSYGPGEDKEVVNENSPVADVAKNPRSARLIHAEQAVLKNGGACLRLAGLYHLDRGAHNFWLTSGKAVSGRPDGFINLLHYDDAAGSALAAVSVGPTVVSGNIFLISDGHPMTRLEICQSTLQAKKYQGMALPEFLGTDSDSIGKIYDGSASNKALKWDPRYESFDAFMASQG
jgi:nucleoside-diphosphate-sugar epimerase